MTSITIEQILLWKPCEDYDTEEKIISKTDDRWPKTPLEIADLDIPADDRLWVLLRPEIIPEKQLHLLACDFAERVLPIYETEYPDDTRPRHAIETKRRWVANNATDNELRSAMAAVWAAAGYAAITDVMTAARAATRDAARAAVGYAAITDVMTAARTAARDAARAAAGYAVMTAARAAVRAAAGYAAGYIELDWQINRVKEILKGDKDD